MGKSWTFKADRSAVLKSHKGAARGLALAAEHILGEARKRVPIEEGTLERSGAASVDENDLRAAVSFDTPYAVKQHEDMHLHHDSGRSAKYLEIPMTTEAAAVKQIIADAIKGEL